MSESSDKRSDTTREQILRAAAHQFAQRPYYAVGPTTFWLKRN